MFFEMETPARHRIWRALWSGLRRKCPRCHRGPLFIKRNTLYERCLECGYPISTALDDLVVLTYVGSASITGLFLLAVFVIRAPKSGFEMLIYLLVAFGLMFGTMDHRKSFAIGLLRVHSLLFDEEAEEDRLNADRPSKRASRPENPRS
jgi:uncharacterized protein (DUF983 family)